MSKGLISVGVLKQKATNIIQDPKSTPEQIRQAGIDFEKGVQEIAQDLQQYAEKKNGGGFIDQIKSALGLTQPQTPQIKGSTTSRIDRTTPQATTPLAPYVPAPNAYSSGTGGASLKVGSIKKLPKLKLPSLSTTQSKTTKAMSNQGVKIKPITPRKQPKLRTRR